MYSPPSLHLPGHSLHLPTNVWGAQDHESPVWSHVVGWPPLLPLCQEVMNFSAPCNTPLCHGVPSSIFAARVHTALSTPNVSRLSTVEPSVAPNAWKSSLRQSIQFCSGCPLPRSSPPTSFPSISRFGRRPAGCLAMSPANRSRRCRMVASTLTPWPAPAGVGRDPSVGV